MGRCLWILYVCLQCFVYQSPWLFEAVFVGDGPSGLDHCTCLPGVARSRPATRGRWNIKERRPNLLPVCCGNLRVSRLPRARAIKSTGPVSHPKAPPPCAAKWPAKINLKCLVDDYTLSPAGLGECHIKVETRADLLTLVGIREDAVLSHYGMLRP